MLTKDTAICIRTTDYSETSQIVTLFTRAAGKISAIAKGSKRPKSAFDGPLEILSCGQIVFSDSSGGKLATLTEFQQTPSFSCTKDNLFALNCCLFGAELVNSLTHDYDPHPELFDSFLQFLQNANKHQEHRQVLALLILFQLTLLREIGLMPILNACANCKTSHGSRATSHEFYFSSLANGLICGDCEANFPDKIKLSKNAFDCLTNVKLIAKAEEKALNEIEKILIHNFTEILHHPPKMAKYVLKS
ncbi:MAG: DNA repair protein RecO [Phycisphaerae bacterium]|nr:DNA repair protein RecO [Phycisphaerae bacterium]MDD5380608.1 DNA repair protein RecO [Phycisphaerae bacterium]